MDPYTIAEQSYKNGYAAGVSSICRCQSCVYWCDSDQSEQDQSAEHFCVRHHRFTTSRYHCGDALRKDIHQITIDNARMRSD